jgi:hypothetical protein
MGFRSPRVSWLLDCKWDGSVSLALQNLQYASLAIRVALPLSLARSWPAEPALDARRLHFSRESVSVKMLLYFDSSHPETRGVGEKMRPNRQPAATCRTCSSMVRRVRGRKHGSCACFGSFMGLGWRRCVSTSYCPTSATSCLQLCIHVHRVGCCT